MTFESYALYPHLTVYQNIASPLKARGLDAADGRPERSATSRGCCSIEQLLDRRPGEVSGGQKQRTALGRTLVADPDVFLLDEPISHLDAKIRHELRRQFHTLRGAAPGRDRLRHPRLCRSAVARRPHRRHGQWRPARADRHAARAVRTPGQPVRRRSISGQPTINAMPSILVQSGDRLSRPGKQRQLRDRRPGPRTRRSSGLPSTSKVVLGLRPQHLRPADERAGGVAAAGQGRDLFEALGSTGVMIADVGGTRLTALTSPERSFRPGEPVMLSARRPGAPLFRCGDGPEPDGT